MNTRQRLVQKQFLNDEEKVIKRLNAVYKQSLSDVSDKVKNLSFQIGKLQKTYDWLDPNDPERERVKSMIQSKIYQKQYQEQLHKQLDSIVDSIKTKQFTTVSSYLDECYTNGVVGTMFDLHGQGIPLIMPIDQESMVRAVQLDSKISKGLYTRLGEDVDLLKRKIIGQVSRGIATGMSYAQVAKGLSDYTRIGYNNAVRIARTEGHRIQNQAAMDTMYSAKEKGADVVKQWDATLDGATRESHAKVDGEIRELDKPFSNGLMFAGDPNGGAAEVVNCRCATLQRARAALDEKELETLKERAAYYGLDKSDQFDDFKKNYLKALTNNGNGDIIPSEIAKPKYLPDYSCPMAKEFGTEHYDKSHEFIVDCPDETVSDVWKKYEGDIKVGSAHYRGTAHASFNTISLDIDEVAKGNSISTPYQTLFHEGGHAIDSLARGEVQGGSIWARHYSSAYKNGLFPSTIKDEVQELVKVHADRIKADFAAHAGDIGWFRANGYMYAWQSKPPKYSKSLAYAALEKEIKNNNTLLARSDLSDILEGATAAKIQCGAGHGANYWRERTVDGIPDGLATEAFAEMVSATLSNPESLATIKKYLPKSYGIFKEMLENLK